MAIAYSASTEGATFLLDELGVCRRVLLKRASGNQQTLESSAVRSRAEAARMVVGAQYVASIDTRVAGGLVPMPRPGAALLFAYADDSGRLAVVRTAPLVRFETIAEPDDTVPVPDLDDECMTIPLTHAIERSVRKSLAESGERATPTWLLDPDDTAGIFDDGEDTVPPLPPTWPKLPVERSTRVRPISIVDVDEAAPTQRQPRSDKRPAARGMLPKKATRR